MNRVRLLTVSIALLAVGAPANAGVFQGTSLATFGAFTPGTLTEETNGSFSPLQLTSTFKSGDGLPNRNQLTMTGLIFDTDASTPFALETLTYFNGQTTTGTAATDVAVSEQLQFSAPPGTPDQTFPFEFHFDITPNIFNPLSNPGNDDILTPQNLFSSQTFTVGNQTYTLHLLGFSSDGGATITTSFELPEDQQVSSTLYAEITTNLGPAAAPEPASLTMLGIGAFGLFGYRLRNRKKVIADA